MSILCANVSYHVIPGLTGDPEGKVQGFFVYIMASQRNGTLYIGVTSDLVKRVWQHKNGVTEGFTAEYAVHQLVYYEAHGSIEDAIVREKRMKRWDRRWKLEMIEDKNPQWVDLYSEICA